MEGKLSSLKYECNGRLHKAEIRGNKVNIPLEACRFIQNSRGIIKGRVAHHSHMQRWLRPHAGEYRIADILALKKASFTR